MRSVRSQPLVLSPRKPVSRSSAVSHLRACGAPAGAICGVCDACTPKSVASPRRIPKMLSHPEVARAIEQDLIQALVTCFTTVCAGPDGFGARHHASIMIRFEEILAEHLSQPFIMTELCELVGVSDRALRSCCAEFLGMSPIRYVLLRRLREVGSALQDGDPDTVNAAEVAHRFRFCTTRTLRRNLPRDI